MKEIARFKIQPYVARQAIITGFNEAGYGTRVEELKQPFPSYMVDYWVIVYEKS